MKAAVVTSFTTPPRYEDIDAPEPSGPGDLVVDVVAAGLHPRVRSQADGSHYTSTDELPIVPGIDGVGRGPDGRLRYFVLPDTTRGSMAERAVIDERRSVLLPHDADEIAVAAAMNPAMSSWVALRRRIDFRSGQRVLVLGATGNAGRLAVQVARHLGASAVVAAGRDRRRLADSRRLWARRPPWRSTPGPWPAMTPWPEDSARPRGTSTSCWTTSGVSRPSAVDDRPGDRARAAPEAAWHGCRSGPWPAVGGHPFSGAAGGRTRHRRERAGLGEHRRDPVRAAGARAGDLGRPLRHRRPARPSGRCRAGLAGRRVPGPAGGSRPVTRPKEHPSQLVGRPWRRRTSA